MSTDRSTNKIAIAAAATIGGVAAIGAAAYLIHQRNKSKRVAAVVAAAESDAKRVCSHSRFRLCPLIMCTLCEKDEWKLPLTRVAR
jgi:uncharacterized membrane protein YebE (DUF533 family)